MVPETSASTFPSHDIPTDEKDAAWCKKYLLAMYAEANARQHTNMFFSARDKWKEYREYGLSQQSVLPYRKWLTGSDPGDKTWVNINWQIPAIGSKYRNILVNKMMAREFNIVCTPIDPLSTDKTAKWYADLKAKMLMGKVANKIAPELLQTTALAKREGDPDSMEDFAMRTSLGFKTKIAMDAELGIQVVFNKTRFKAERRMYIEDLVDWGAGVLRDYVDENDEVGIRRVDGMNFICSSCVRPDFADMTWGAEMKWYTLADVAAYFTGDDLKKIAECVAGKNGNPKVVPYVFAESDFDKYKILVVDGAWLSTNTDYYKRSFDSLGNYGFRKKRPDKRDGRATIEVNGAMKPKFLKSDLEVVYKGKYIVDTEFIFDYGMETDMKRKKSDFKRTKLPWHVFAPDFHQMTCLGIMERMVPFIDQYNQIHFKAQNFLNRWIPYLINIDLAALENTPLGKGGKALTPMQALDMVFQSFLVVTRQKNAITANPERNAPVTITPTQMAQEIAVLRSEMKETVQSIRDVTGLNEVVDGTGPADRTNVTAQQQAQQGSNNAINHFVYADSQLIESVADSSLMRLQRVLKRKKVSGYVHALDSGQIKFAQVSDELPLYEYAISLEDRPETEMKQALLQQLAVKDQQGLIQPEDYFTIMNMTNLKEMEMKLTYSSKKRLQDQQANQAAQSQQQSQSAIMAAQATEKAKQDTLTLEYELKMKLEDKKGAWGVEEQKARAGGVLDQSALAAIKEVFLQVMAQDHEAGMASGAGSPAPGGAPAPGQQPAPQQQAQPLPASLQE